MPNSENLGAKFTIDISDLKAGLAQANRLIRESESEFLEAAAGMEDWEKSAEGLTKRVKTLSKQFELQQKKVTALVDEKERIIKTMKEEGKSNEEIEKAVDNVNKSIQREGKQLDTLKKKLETSKSKLDSFEAATDGASKSLDDMSAESNQAKDATDKLTDEIKDQKTQLDKLTRAYSNAVLEQGDMSDEAADLKKQIKKLNDELEANEKKLDSATDGLGGLNKSAKDAGGGFDLAKGAAAGLVAGGITALIGAAGNAVSSLMDLSVETREARTNMAKLQTTFEDAGFSSDDATETFRTMYGVLGDDGQATEATAHLAKMVKTEEDLSKWTTIATGVYAEFGDSLPIEALTEASNETAKVGTVTGALADALNWSTLSSEEWKTALGSNKKALNAFEKATKDGESAEDAFNAALSKCSSEQERQQLITETLTLLYGDSAEAFRENNSSVIAAQEATAKYNEKMAILGGQVEPLNVAMTNLKTTLVEAVTPAVGALASGTADLINKMLEGKESTDLLTESQRAVVTAADKAATSYLANKEAADEMADGQMANIRYGEDLLIKLSNIVDENGRVKEGEEAHADFLLNEYNNALGTEYDNLTDIFDANGKIKDSVYDVIEAKKAQVQMEVYEETYRQAVQNVADAEKARVTQLQELVLQEEVVAEKRKAYNDAVAEAHERVANASAYEREAVEKDTQRRLTAAYGEWAAQEKILTDKQTAYNETEDVLYQYYADISAYEKASIALMEGNTEEALKHLNRLGDGYITAESIMKESAEEKKKILEQQVIDTELNAELMRKAYADGVEGVTEDMVKTAEDQAKQAKEEFKKVGGNIAEGISSGAKNKKSSITTSLKSLISSALAAAKKAAGINSPSRLFKREVGAGIGEGVAVGVDESTSYVVKAIGNQVDSALKAYDVGKINDAISSNINVSAGSKGGSGGLASGSNGGVTVNQNNYYSQAHSRYELYKTKQDTAAAVRAALGGA